LTELLMLASASAAPDLKGAEAPDFALKTTQSRNLRLSEFRGEVVLINFWAGWCGACRQAMPALNDIHDKYQRAGLVMLSINVDDDTDHVQHIASSLNIRYPVLLDDRKTVSQLYRLDNLPLTVLIDREGAVRFVQSGYTTGDEQKLMTPLRAMLNE
jgi:peroxiredoxin